MNDERPHRNDSPTRHDALDLVVRRHVFHDALVAQDATTVRSRYNAERAILRNRGIQVDTYGDYTG